MTSVSLKISVCILFVVVCLFSDPDSGVFFGENQLFPPSPTSATLPPSGFVHLLCLTSLTCLLPSSAVLGGLTRSSERVEAWISLSPLFQLNPFVQCPLPNLSLPTVPCTPARFIRYHCYVRLPGSSPTQTHSECSLSTSQWLCCLTDV